VRVKLILNCAGNNLLSANYYYPLSASVYNFLRLGSPEFSEFLHDTGFKLDGKSYKFFSFALRFEQFKFEDNFIRLTSPTAALFITSPLTADFIQNFITGTFENQKIKIYNTTFTISQVEILNEPQINRCMKFSLLSPIVISTKKEFNGKLMPYYFRYYDDINEINKAVANNLKNKYKLLFKNELADMNLTFRWDEDYIRNMTNKKRKMTKKQTIKEGRIDETEIIGNQLPFFIEGEPDLIKVGYDCGFGEKNSLGFGFAELRH
jgi:CRISPR-associated endoribonuclease Cas6